jgi:hypothetical protein
VAFGPLADEIPPLTDLSFAAFLIMPNIAEE